MTSRARTIPEFPVANTISANDLFIIEKVGANNTTSIISGTKLKIGIFSGPYANDSVAASSNVAIGEPYYTAAGDLKIRLV